MKRITMITTLTLLVLAACNKTEDASVRSIQGTYIGSFITDGLKSLQLVNPGNGSATAEITRTGDGQVEVHCYGVELDSTFRLNFYENHDSIMVCLTGNDFDNLYGHMLGQGHMAGGMMGDILKGETEWMHHMKDEHKVGEEHFGGFDMMNHSFGYRFKMREGDVTYYLKFHGVKQ